MINTSIASWPDFTREEIDAVAEVLASNRVNYWTGQEGRLFEQEFARWAGADHAIALANGTVALDLALMALNVGPGDEVIVTPRTFIASTSCVVNAGARPIFVDVDRDSGNINAETIAQAITKRTRAIIPVHLAGWPCEMDAIMAIARDRDIAVIEDCAQAHGAKVGAKSVGSIGDIGAWSFCQDKIMTTGGEGGMVTTDDRDRWSRMWSFKDHGKSWESVYERAHPPGFRWVHDSFGTNWRMLEVQAAIGRIQLCQMKEWTARRTAIASAIAKALAPFSSVVRVPLPPAHLTHAFYRLYAYVEPAGLRSGWSRDRIVAEIMARGIPAYQGSCSEVYLEKAFDGTGIRPEARLPVAKELGETSIMFLTHPTITDEELERCCSVIGDIFGLARA